jgi:pyruvate dehydrogenase E2 component (dihydrolipoamide acetyltransferase)
MARLLRMPEVAANAVEAVLAHWPIPQNMPFRAGDAIATVETEKAVVDVPADADGVILSMLVEAGAAVGVGTPIALLGDPGEVVGDLDALLAGLGVGPQPAAADEASAVDGAGMPVVPIAEAAGGRGARVFSSPLARRLAREAGLPIADLRGSGPGGRIVRRDVEQAARAREGSATGPFTTPQPGSPVGTSTAGGGHVDIPHSRIRRAIAARLTESTRDAPHFSLHSTARVDRLMKLRARLNNSGPVRISVNDLVVMAAARAYVLVPEMNVIWTPDAVRSFTRVDISVAIATESGLVTPVLRSVDQKTLSAVASANSDLVARARSGELRQHELEGGTLTVTNLGMFDTQDFAAIINPPQSAVLAVGAALAKPISSKGKLKVGTVMSFTLSVDHRPIDGATAARWMAAFVSLIEEPVRVLI